MSDYINLPISAFTATNVVGPAPVPAEVTQPTQAPQTTTGRPPGPREPKWKAALAVSALLAAGVGVGLVMIDESADPTPSVERNAAQIIQHEIDAALAERQPAQPNAAQIIQNEIDAALAERQPVQPNAAEIIQHEIDAALAERQNTGTTNGYLDKAAIEHTTTTSNTNTTSNGYLDKAAIEHRTTAANSEVETVSVGDR